MHLFESCGMVSCFQLSDSRLQALQLSLLSLACLAVIQSKLQLVAGLSKLRLGARKQLNVPLSSLSRALQLTLACS